MAHSFLTAISTIASTINLGLSAIINIRALKIYSVSVPEGGELLIA